MGTHHAGELHLAHAQRAAAARAAFIQPRKKPSICHSASSAQAARHHRIVLEMAGEEPEVRLDVELGHDLALAGVAAGIRRS